MTFSVYDMKAVTFKSLNDRSDKSYRLNISNVEANLLIVDKKPAAGQETKF